ncbi:CD63 antigen-like [Anthonomus grandis grandis]|uniref:CD63 antigen-like n=1 Tax=Anthonomus grandis grandis TaxID=2921223 RepID=UPI0021663FBA|nr:CD63 antigen-like [Anthonomus grandis grandis]XP_050304876.1 CD63 antigen-like [Anthonomus grandis grandis]XP_050304877.1 CD63 antigen-like [Anthonomus grandis grandis]XP_050304878.1 CD63 antigen-like [Anthonomus grandis grandis]
MSWIGKGEGALRRRMPLRRAGARSAKGGGLAGGPGGRAMRYYRFWIYTCNTALLAGALAFTGAAVKTVIFDFRRSLVPSLTLYQPSFLYAYLALATQGGALQLLGCLAALKLSERLLNAYWLLLLVLIFGDVVIGAFWAYRFEKICQELRPALRLRFQQEYGSSSGMTTLWDRLQTEDECCGVTGPHEFANLTGTTRWEMPASCCSEKLVGASNNATRCAKVHLSGCDERLLAYLRSTASLLAILGYCVLAFLKLCFLGILRYEIREMIQKIRILRAELELPNINGTLPGTIKAEAAECEKESLLIRPDSSPFLSSPPAQLKNPNGNNNYELREYQKSHDDI